MLGASTNFFQKRARNPTVFPKSLDEVAKAGIRLVVADSNDPDGIGFVQWRVAFYVAGSEGAVLNWLNLFDDFLVWHTIHSSVAVAQI